MNPITDVNPLCPCWIILDDGSRERCDMPVGISGGTGGMRYDFMQGHQQASVDWSHVTRIENIADPSRQLQIRQ